MINLSKKYKFLPYLLIAPALILIGIFKLYPVFITLVESFYNDGAFTLNIYRGLSEDSVFWNSLWVTIKMNLVMIPVQLVLSFILALIVNTNIKGVGVVRSIFFLPFTISLTVATIIWNMMLNPNNGVMNSLLSVFGIPPQGFLIDSSQALWCIVLIATWRGISYWMMFLLTGLKNIDTSIYEAAKIDGAGYARIIFSITLPLMKKMLLFVAIANTTANLLLFVPMQLITKGGPEGSTNVLMYEAYKSAFMYANRPRSSAIITILLVIIIIVSLIQRKFLSED